MVLLSGQLTEIKKCINKFKFKRKHSEFKHMKDYDDKVYNLNCNIHIKI